MDLLSIFFIGIGLSMDACAVSLAKGMSLDKKDLLKYAFILAFAFGFFQALMPAIGYFAGIRFTEYIQAFDHWIAFILLSFIGINMIREGKEEKEDEAFKSYLDSKSNEELVKMLEEQDRKALEKIHPNNRKRLIRALQICHSGTPKSEQEDKQQHIPLYDVYFLGLDVDRNILHDRINKRVDIMFENGLVKEVEELFSNPQSWEYTSFQGIGYKEFKDYFLGEKNLEEVKTAIKTHSRQYAKRQYTWFKNQMPVHWFEAQDRDEIYDAVKEWLSHEDK